MIAFCYHLVRSTRNNNSRQDFALTHCIKRLSHCHKESKQTICSANQSAGFHMMDTFAFNELMFHFLQNNFQ